MTTNPSHRSTSRSLPSGSFSSLWTYLLLLALLVLPLALQAQVNPEAGWTGGGGGNLNWSSAANWLTNAGYTSPLPNPFTQLVRGDGSAMVNHSSGIGTPNGAVEHVDAPWTIGVLKTTGRSFSLYGQDLTIQQATGGSTLTLANGAIQIGNNNAFRTISISNNIIFDSSAYNADPLNYTHLIIMRAGPNHTIDFYGQVSKPGTNGGVTFRTTSPVNIYGGLSASLTPDLTDTANGHHNVHVAMLDNAAPITFHKANNSWKYMSIDRGVVSIGTNNALPTGSQISVGNANNRVSTIALNNWNQTLNFIEEAPGQTASHTITTGTGAGGTLTLEDNNVTNDWSALTISGTGRLVKNGNGKLTIRNNQTYNGGTTISGGILQLGVGIAGGLLNSTGSITNNGTLIINSTDAFTLSGDLRGTGNLQKLAASTTTLNGVNSYTGTTYVGGGTLALVASGAINNSSAITLANGSTLNVSAASDLTRSAGQSLVGTGTVIGNVTASPGATVTVGNSTGILAISGNVSFDTDTLNMELGGDPTSVDGTVNDLITVSGALSLTNVTTVSITQRHPATLSTTTPYHLIQYGSLATGGPTNLNAVLTYPGRYGFTVVDSPPYIDVAVSSSLVGNLLFWRGGDSTDPTRWDLATTTNWLNGANPDSFQLLDPVAFDDTAVTNRATLTGSLTANSLVASNNSLNYTLDGSGSLSSYAVSMEGSGSFAISNSVANNLGAVTVNNGTLVIANGAANTYTSVLTNNGGSLVIANPAANAFPGLTVNGGNLIVANSVANTYGSLTAAGGTLTFNQPGTISVATPIVGGGTVAKTGAGTLALAAGSPSFIGNFQINDGVVRIDADQALGAGTATIASGATLDLNSRVITSVTTLTAVGDGVGGRGAIDNSGTYQFSVGYLVLTGDTTFGSSGNEGWEVTGPAACAGYKLTKINPGDVWFDAGDPDFGDVDIKAGGFGSSYLGTTLGRPASTITIRSNASLVFWDSVSAGEKNIVVENFGILRGYAYSNYFTGTMSLMATGLANVDSGALLAYYGSITGAGGLGKIGVGNFALYGTNQYDTGTLVLAGALRLGNNLALGTNHTVAVAVSGVGSGGFVSVNASRLELANGTVIPPSVNVIMDSAGASDFRTTMYATNGGINEWQGPINLRSNGLVQFGAAANTTLILSGPIGDTNFIGTFCLRSGGTSQGILSGNVNIGGDMLKTDSGTWTINSTSNQWTSTQLAVGTTKLGTNDGLCITAPLQMGQGDGNTTTFDLNGWNQRIPSLANSGTGTKRIGNDSLIADSTLIYDGGTNISVYGGTLVNAYSVGTMRLGLTLASGILRLNGSNSYTGPTLVKNGAKLGGTGSIRSEVTVESGGTLAPGASIGTLSIVSNLTLNAGSFSAFELSHTPLGCDKVVGLSNVVYGGTLVLTNVNLPPLAAGDSFQLFQSAAYNGSFSSIDPATPGAGLAWNTANLSVNGTISIVATAPPNVDGTIKLPDGNIQLTLSGPTGSGYSVLASTNVGLPLTNWSVIGSGTITTSPFNFTDLNATNFTQRFYRMSIP